jgi:formylglycine-generating enzyme required for sulfatase activity
VTWTGSAYKKAEGRNWRSPGFKQADSHPAVCVSWEDAAAYAEWLSRETGAAYRLPSEAEWEYAARAGTGTRYFWGNDARGGDACTYANGAGQELSKRLKGQPILPCRDRYQFTAPAGSLKASPFGLLDAIGNAAEWTEDCYHDSYAGAPSDGSAWTAGNCQLRVFRGGGWGDGPSYLRSALRSYIDPDVGIDGVGFRLARTLSQ